MGDDIQQALPAQPSRRSIRLHAFFITGIAGLIGVLMAAQTVVIDWKAVLAIGAIMLGSFLVHASKSAIDLNKWMDSATRMVEAHNK